MLNVDLKNTVDVVRLVRKSIDPIPVDTLINLDFSKKKTSWIVPPSTLAIRRKTMNG